MVASSAGKSKYGGKVCTGRVWDCWISPCHGPFSLDGRFKTYKPFIHLIFQFSSGRGEPRTTETAGTESVDTGAQLYLHDSTGNVTRSNECVTKLIERLREK
jgi:hypothetical protein